MSLTLNTLGQLEILWDGRPAPGLNLRKSQALLIYLALNPGCHDRSRLAGLLWGDLSEKNARRNLRHALHRIRRSLNSDVLDSNRNSAGLSTDLSLEVDVLSFEAAIARADRCHRDQALDSAISHLEAAAGLYQGDFLSDFDVPDCLGFEEWVARRRAQLRQQVLDALDAIVRYWSRRGAYERALSYARRQVALEPLRETAHRQVMTLLALTGQRSAALAQYDTCRQILAEELGLEPLEESKALYQAIRSSAVDDPMTPEANRETPSIVDLPFVGREEEHAALVERWEAARRGEGRLTLVEGEAGVGKTRLVEEIIRYVETRGVRVLRGRCYEFGDGVPYQPLAEALRTYFGDEQIALSSTWLAELARLLPELHEDHPDLPEVDRTTGEAARQRLFEAVTRLLSSLSNNHATLCLFLDDLHWADQATLDLLHYIVRHLHNAPIWLVGTYRPEEAGLSHPLTRLRQGLSRDHRVARLALAPLSATSVRVLAQSLVGEGKEDALSQFLYRESEGNAFILMEMVRALQEKGALVIADDQPFQGKRGRAEWTWTGVPGTEALPPSVQDIILQRVGRLSETAQRLLSIVAVIGQPFDAALLYATSGRDAGAVEKSLDEWLARRLIRPESVGGQYDVSHDKIRAVVYHAIEPDRRRRLHLLVGEGMEAHVGSRVEEYVAALAYHFEQAGVVEKALLYLPMAAAKAAEVYANQQALGYLRRALALCPSHDDRRWPILLQQVDLLRLLGDYEAAIAACQQVIEAGPESWQARAYSQMAQIYRIRRDYDAARRYVDASQAMNSAGRPSRAQQARDLQTLGEIEREQTNLGRAQELFESALAIYREIDDQHGRANSLKGLGDTLSARGRYTEARRYYEQAVTIFKELGDKQSAATCLQGIGVASWRQRDHAASRTATLEGLDICRAIGDRRGEAAALGTLGLLAIVQSDHVETQRCWNASVAIYRELGLDKRTASGLHNLGISYMECGEMAASRQCLEQALEINLSAGSPRDQALDLGWLGKLHWLLKDYAAAIDCLDRALALDRSIGGGEEEDWHLIWRAAVACESGDLMGARRFLQQVERMVAQGSENLKAHDVERWRASIALAEGDAEKAERSAQQALAQARAAGATPSTLGEILTLLGRSSGADSSPVHAMACSYFDQALELLPDAVPTIYLRAMALYHYGRYLMKREAPHRAESCLQEAQAIFDRLGIAKISATRSLSSDPT